MVNEIEAEGLDVGKGGSRGQFTDKCLVREQKRTGPVSPQISNCSKCPSVTH